MKINRPKAIADYFGVNLKNVMMAKRKTVRLESELSQKR